MGMLTGSRCPAWVQARLSQRAGDAQTDTTQINRVHLIKDKSSLEGMKRGHLHR
jgi:hypothetical protein